MSVTVRILGPNDAHVLDHVAPDVFDNPVDPQWTAEFLADPRHHLAVALEDTMVVGMASAVHYVHPDKAPALWINEVGVASTHRRQGIARQLLHTLFARGHELGCREAWVATEASNTAARQLYAAVGGAAASELVVMFEFELTHNT